MRVDIGGLEYYSDYEIEGVRIFKLDKEIVVESLKNQDDSEYDIYIPERK